MISVAEATRLVAATIRPLGVEYLSLTLAAGRVLREDLRADRDFPPFNRVAMDGMAVRYETLAAGQTEFRIHHTQFAGQPPQPLPDATAAVEIMTGAMLPPGVDTVIRYEDLTFRTDCRRPPLGHRAGAAAPGRPQRAPPGRRPPAGRPAGARRHAPGAGRNSRSRHRRGRYRSRVAAAAGGRGEHRRRTGAHHRAACRPTRSAAPTP